MDPVRILAGSFHGETIYQNGSYQPLALVRVLKCNYKTNMIQNSDALWQEMIKSKASDMCHALLIVSLLQHKRKSFCKNHLILLTLFLLKNRSRTIKASVNNLALYLHNLLWINCGC